MMTVAGKNLARLQRQVNLSDFKISQTGNKTPFEFVIIHSFTIESLSLDLQCGSAVEEGR